MSDLLSLPDIKTIEPPQENETDMMFKVEAVGPPERCPECGFDKLYKHSSRNQLIMDLPIRLKRVGLQLNRRRYKCRECGSTFWERLISVDEKRSMTKRLLKSIQEQSMSKTFVEVAESVGVDEKTIRNVFKDYVALKEREYQFETPKWLGIDEIHIIRRPRLVLTNIERRTIYDIKPNRNKETVIQRLSEISDRTYIEYVTMDMWKPYILNTPEHTLTPGQSANPCNGERNGVTNTTGTPASNDEAAPPTDGSAASPDKAANTASGYSSGYSADQGYSGVAPACAFGGGDSFIIFQNIRSSSGKHHLTNIYNLNPL